MRLVICESSAEVADLVASYVVKRINEFKPTATRPFVLGLPTGSSPELAYGRLVEMHRAQKVSFEHVVTFNMDEYCDLPREHPESYHSFMWEKLFRHIDIQPQNVNILDGNARDVQEECTRYEAKMKSLGGVHLFLAGIGPDGHIAFNEPGSSLSSRTRVKTLAQETVVANARFFGGDLSQVPRKALTHRVHARTSVTHAFRARCCCIAAFVRPQEAHPRALSSVGHTIHLRLSFGRHEAEEEVSTADDHCEPHVRAAAAIGAVAPRPRCGAVAVSAPCDEAKGCASALLTVQA